jgi:hypothetical protein
MINGTAWTGAVSLELTCGSSVLWTAEAEFPSQIVHYGILACFTPEGISPSSSCRFATATLYRNSALCAQSILDCPEEAAFV